MLDEIITPPSTGLGQASEPIRVLLSVATVGVIGAGLGYGSGLIMHARNPKGWAVGGAVIAVGASTLGMITA